MRSTLNLDDWTNKKLTELSKEQHVSRSAIIRMLIVEKYKKEKRSKECYESRKRS